MADKNLYYLARYKKNIVSLLINSAPIVDLIAPDIDDRVELDDNLLGGEFEVPKRNGDGTDHLNIQGHIFDYIFTPETSDESDVFICIEALVNAVDDVFFNDCVLFVHIYVPKKRVRLTSKSNPTQSKMIKAGFIGNRVDMLCDAVDRLLNGNKEIGIGEVRPVARNAVTLSIPNTTYYGKCLTYNVKNYIEENECD